MKSKTHRDEDENGVPLTFACPECGEEVPVGSEGCPRCRAQNPSEPWRQDDYLDGVDVPEDPESFDYDEFVQREFRGRPVRGKFLKNTTVLAVIALLLLVGMVLMTIPLGVLDRIDSADRTDRSD